jgi:Rab3 GTPase-activating protein catalytic subunit
VDDRTKYLTSLGDSDERVQAQLDTLLSDMQAFKAANPGCVIEDFVRWHSPRDWETNEDGSNGQLSERMLIAGNVWHNTWASARPVPVNLQQRLFNETKEAEMVLQRFEAMSIRDLIGLILPVVYVTAARRLVEEATDCTSLVESRLIELCGRISKCTRTANIDEYFQLRFEILKVESAIARYHSISRLMESYREEEGTNAASEVTHQHLKDFACQLLTNSTQRKASDIVRVFDAPNGPLCMILRRIMNTPFNNESTELRMPPPSRKRYTLRQLIPRPGRDSRVVPQRMFVSIKEGEFRICGSFTCDLTFM